MPVNPAARRGKVDCLCERCGGTFAVKPSKVARGAGRYCSRACQYGLTLAERLDSKVNRAGPVPQHRPEFGPCWEWQGATANGYGTIGGGPGTGILKTHRVSWERHNGAIPEGLYVLHHCDNRRCVNPAHLFLGDHQANMADMFAKGRGHVFANPAGDAHHLRQHPERIARGERTGSAKLTEAQVVDMRQRFARGEVTAVALAAEFSVSLWTIYPVLKRKTWKHLP